MFVHSPIACVVTSGMKTIAVFTISLLVLSSPFIIFANPQLIAAAGPISPAANAEERLGTNNYHSTINKSPDASNTAASKPSTAIGTPTTQAALQIPRTLQSSDLVGSLAFYEVTFITSTTGAIDKIRMDFPFDTNVAAAGLIERIGIGGGTLLKSGSSITYDVTTPVSIPSGTFIRLEMFGIRNPSPVADTAFTAMITTRDSGGNLIDGPSPTNVYIIRKIGSNDIATGAITFDKPAENFMKKVNVNDSPGGHAVGWNPDGAATVFEISEPLASDFNAGAIINVDSTVAADPICSASQVFAGQIEIFCTSPPADDSTLDYIIINVPFEIIS